MTSGKQPEEPWRGPVRRAIRSGMTRLPHGAARFVYTQISGTIKRLGGRPDEHQIVSMADNGLLSLDMNAGRGRMSLDLHDGMQRNLYYCGFWETAVTACLSRCLKPGSTFVDIGANIGYYTIWAALRVGPTGRIFSFEPNPKAYGFLEENVRLSGFENCQLYNVALGETSGMGVLEFNNGSLGMSHLTPAIGEDASHEEHVSVPIHRLDEYLARIRGEGEGPQPREIDLMKIDAEGAEMMILKGASQFLSSPSLPYMLLEVEDRWLKRFGSSSQEIITFLQDAGYQPHQILDGGKLEPLKLQQDRIYKDNFLFVPKNKPVP